MTSWLNWQTTNNIATLLTNQINNKRLIPSTDVIQLSLTLKITTAQVAETSVTVNNNSPFPDCVHPDDHTQPTYEMISGFKPYKVLIHVKLTSFQPSVLCSSSIKFYTNAYASLTNQNARFGFILNLFIANPRNYKGNEYKLSVKRFLGSLVDKRYFWSVNGYLDYHRPILTNDCPPKQSQKPLYPKPGPILRRVSEVGNSR